MSTSLHSSQNKQRARSDTFKVSMDLFAQMCSTDSNAIYFVQKTVDALGFHKRRFYDVVNVLDVIGVVRKLDSESFKWIGFHGLKDRIYEIAKNRGVFDMKKTLSEIIPSNDSISISKFTEYFLVCFMALDQKYLDIKEISAFLSRNNDRGKTSLCKLYQIAQIFDAIGIITKTERTSEICLNDEYFFSPRHNPKEKVMEPDLFQLLSRPVNHGYIAADPIYKRNVEYQMGDPYRAGHSRSLRPVLQSHYY